MNRCTNFLVGATGIMLLSVLTIGQPVGGAFGDDAPPKKGEAKKGESTKADGPKDREKAAPVNAKADNTKKAEVKGKAVPAQKRAVMRKDADFGIGELWNAAVRALVGDDAAVAPPAPPAAIMQQAQNEAQLKQIEQNYGTQFRQLYRSELHFMRVVCKPTRQQYEKIAADSGPEKAIIRAFATMMVDGQHGRVQQADGIDPRKMVALRLAKVLRPTLSAEQAASYQKELDLRDAAKKRVALLGLVAKVDKVLTLTAEQRRQLGEILEKNWHDSWNNKQYFMYGGQYFPAMPDAKINPILTETQKAVWLGLQKGNIHFGWNGFGLLLEIEEEVWNEAGKDNEAAKPVEKK